MGLAKHLPFLAQQAWALGLPLGVLGPQDLSVTFPAAASTQAQGPRQEDGQKGQQGPGAWKESLPESPTGAQGINESPSYHRGFFSRLFCLV